MRHFDYKYYIFVLIFIVCGCFLRLFQLENLPIISHRDEIAIGYNAYSILKTGRDEHGKKLPLNFRSFGDYKLPGLIYSTIPFVNFFGLNQLAVRLPTALLACLTLFSAYWLAAEIGMGKKERLVFSFVFSLSFWHISQARNAYEPMTGLFWLTMAWASWLRSFKNKFFFIPAILSYTISIFFYNVPLFLIPILFLVSTWLKQNELKSEKNKIFFLAMLLLSLIIFGGASLLFSQVNAGKTDTTVFFAPETKEFAQNLVHAGLVGGMPSRVTRVTNHWLIISLFKFVENYLACFSPKYLFFSGDNNDWHNLKNIGLGNINPVLLIPFSLGIFSLIKNIKQQKNRLLLLYLLTSPLLCAATIDAPVTNRLLDLHLAVMLITALGIVQLWQKLKNKFVFYSLGVIYLGIFLLFLQRYFLIHNHHLPALWEPGVKKMIEQVDEVQNKYDAIYVTSDLEVGYTFFAFYTPFEPQNFIDQAEWIEDGFVKVSRYQKYYFQDFPMWKDLTTKNVAQFFNQETDKILVVVQKQPPEKAQLVFEDLDWRGRWLWSAWETSTKEAYEKLLLLPETKDRQSVKKYLQTCLDKNCQTEILLN